MYTNAEYSKLAKKYGALASWALWNYADPTDVSIISQNISKLHSKYVLIGLNVSRSLSNKPWVNFHSKGNIRKLMYGCDSNKLSGSYFTDLFKDVVELKSTNIESQLSVEKINANVKLFNQEMVDIKISRDSQFIVFGTPSSILSKYFNKYFRQDYNHTVHYHYHYAYYGITDKDWVEGLWKKLNINQNYENTRKAMFLRKTQ